MGRGSRVISPVISTCLLSPMSLQALNSRLSWVAVKELTVMGMYVDMFIYIYVANT